MKPEALLDPANLPEDLRWVPAHYRLHPDDPVYLLIAWHWQRVKQSEDALKSGIVELKTLVDTRAAAMAEATNAATAAAKEIQGARSEIKERRAQVSKQLEAEMAPALAKARELQTMLEAVGPQLRAIQRKQVLASLLTGITLGVLGALVLFGT